MRCDRTHHAQGIRVGLQRRLFGANNATALSKAKVTQMCGCLCETEPPLIKNKVSTMSIAKKIGFVLV